MLLFQGIRQLGPMPSREKKNQTKPNPSFYWEGTKLMSWARGEGEAAAPKVNVNVSHRVLLAAAHARACAPDGSDQMFSPTSCSSLATSFLTYLKKRKKEEKKEM